jgi:hypothetical protein
MKPLVEDSRPRLCPVCFGPVELVETGEDRGGYFEKWECQRPDARNEPQHLYRVDKRTRQAGVFVLRRSDYEKAWRKRRRVQRESEREET